NHSPGTASGHQRHYPVLPTAEDPVPNRAFFNGGIYGSRGAESNNFRDFRNACRTARATSPLPRRGALPPARLLLKFGHEPTTPPAPCHTPGPPHPRPHQRRTARRGTPRRPAGSRPAARRGRAGGGGRPGFPPARREPGGGAGRAVLADGRRT